MIDRMMFWQFQTYCHLVMVQLYKYLLIICNYVIKEVINVFVSSNRFLRALRLVCLLFRATQFRLLIFLLLCCYSQFSKISESNLPQLLSFSHDILSIVIKSLTSIENQSGRYRERKLHFTFHEYVFNIKMKREFSLFEKIVGSAIRMSKFSRWKSSFLYFFVIRDFNFIFIFRI